MSSFSEEPIFVAFSTLHHSIANAYVGWHTHYHTLLDIHATAALSYNKHYSIVLQHLGSVAHHVNLELFIFMQILCFKITGFKCSHQTSGLSQNFLY